MIRRVLALRRLLRAESLSQERLAADRDRKLRRLMSQAVNRVPFYGELYARHGIDAGALRGASDLARLPVVDKFALRAAGSQAWEQTPRESAWISTSGSTGVPFRFPIDMAYDQLRKAQYLRPYLSNGRRAGDRVLRLTAVVQSHRPWFTRFGLLPETQLPCGTAPQLVLERWRANGCGILQGYPSALRALAQYCLASGDRLEPGPRLIFTDSELLAADTRGLIERAFGARVIDIFGTYETDNIAYQCEAGGGYHVTTDCVVVEVLRDGRVAQPGEDGELVVTVLDNLRSPFIRYNLHDLGRWATAPCSCGRSFPLLEVLKGRAEQMLRLPDGSERSAMDVVVRLYAFADLLLYYQLQQHTPQRYSLLYVPTPAFTPAHEDTILAAVVPLLAPAEVRLRCVTEIPLTPSKKWLAFVRDPDDGSAS